MIVGDNDAIKNICFTWARSGIRNLRALAKRALAENTAMNFSEEQLLDAIGDEKKAFDEIRVSLVALANKVLKDFPRDPKGN